MKDEEEDGGCYTDLLEFMWHLHSLNNHVPGLF